MRHFTYLLPVVFGAVLGAPPVAPVALGAQPLQVATPAEARDSAVTLRIARRAQADFERIRRRNLSETWAGGSGSCDERVGRFCLTYGTGKDRDDWEPPEEPERIATAREALIALLDSAAARLPGDAWIAGQRVRYLVEQGRQDDAVQAAADCRAAPSWCHVLHGYALHAAGDFAAAESAFDAALARMPEDERDEWTDISMLLEAGEVRAYRRAAPSARAQMERRFWWLSDPLWMKPGNDRRTEHFARLVYDQLQDRARNLEGSSWGSDHRELLIRFGNPVAWQLQRQHSVRATMGPPPLVGFYAPRSRHFFAPLRAVEDPASLAPADWRLADRGSRTAYAPLYIQRFGSESFEHQAAVFRRGDSLVVAAALRIVRDSVPEQQPVQAALIAATDEWSLPARSEAATTEEVARLQVRAPVAPAVVSVELFADSIWARRVRFGLPAEPLQPEVLALSDILLVEPVEPMPNALDEALRSARHSVRVQPGETVILFWEIYGLSARQLESAFLSVSMQRTNVGWVRRAAERVGLLGVETPIRLRWEEVPEPELGVYPRSLAVRLPEELSAGDYVIELVMNVPGRDAVSVQRLVQVER
jgi:tetratricopeptide (TPR) repeat protein